MFFALREGIPINVLRIIDEIEHVVENGKGVMGKKVINEEEFFAKVQSLRSALPKSMKEAEDLMRRGEAIVKSAETEAGRLIDTAEREAEKIVTDARNKAERTVSEAKAHAERVTTDAQSRADRAINDADNYASRTKENAENQAKRTIESANNQAQRTIEEAETQAQGTVDQANNQAQATIEEANTRADHLEQTAKEQAAEMVAEHAVTLRAHTEAEQLLLAAQKDSDEMRRQADDYAFEVLNKMSGVLDKLGHSVEMGKESLRQNSASFANAAVVEEENSYGELYVEGANNLNGSRNS